MSLILLLLGVSLGWAETSMKAPAETAVYQSPRDGSKVLFYLHAGESVGVNSVNENYYRAHLLRRGHNMNGYVQKDDLRSEFELPGEDSSSSASRSEWAIGAEGALFYDVQSAKSFTTSDSVNYSTSNYISVSPMAAVNVQYGGLVDFWRLGASLKAAKFKGNATQTNVVGAVNQSVNLQQTLIGAELKKGWPLFSIKNIYWGLGLGIEKVMQVTLNLNGVNVPTTSADQPIYVSGKGFAGGHWKLSGDWSFFAELEASVIGNESPVMYGVAAQVGLFYWL